MRALVISHDPSEQPTMVVRYLEQHAYRLDTFVVWVGREIELVRSTHQPDLRPGG